MGSAQGELARRLRERGFRVTCLEGDADLAARAADACDEVVCADLDGPLPDLHGPFDVIVFADVLEHLRDPLAAIRRILPALQREGTVWISVPNVAHLHVRLGLLFGRFEYADRGILDRTHLRFFTKRSLRRFVADAGLSVEATTATPVPLPLVVPPRFHGFVLRAVHAASAVLSRAWKGPFAYQFVLRCRTRPT